MMIVARHLQPITAQNPTDAELDIEKLALQELAPNQKGAIGESL